MNRPSELDLSGAAELPVDEPRGDLTAFLGAFAEITTALLFATPEEALGRVVRQARRLASAKVACLEVLSAPDTLLVEAFDGPGGRHRLGQVRTLDEATPYRELLTTGHALIIADAAENDRAAVSAGLGGMALGPVLLLPLPGVQRPLGALTIGGSPGRPPFASVEFEVATLLAGQAVVALELTGRREQQASASVLDPDLIARNLHDVVMQRLFATGLQLQRVAPAVAGPVGATLVAAASSLDQTMVDIRAAILALRPAGTADTGLRRALMHAVAQADRQANG
jgi:signal transduction histidine kinase